MMLEVTHLRSCLQCKHLTLDWGRDGAKGRAGWIDCERGCWGDEAGNPTPNILVVLLLKSQACEDFDPNRWER